MSSLILIRINGHIFIWQGGVNEFSKK